MSRKTKLTKDLTKKIATAISSGNTVVSACGAVGIDEATFYRWIKRGEAGETGYVGFLSAMQEAIHKFENAHVALITRSAIEDRTWQASAWLLERRFPERWGKRLLEINQNNKVDVTIKIDGDIDSMIQQYRSLKELESPKIIEHEKVTDAV